MKKVYNLLLLNLLLFSFCNNINQNKTKFTITGEFENCEITTLYLFKIENNKIVNLDSCLVENNVFEFNGKLELPELYYLSDNKYKNYFPIFIENSEMNFYSKSIEFKNAKLEGSESNKIFLEFNDNILVYDQKLINIKKRLKKIDTLNLENYNNLDSSILAIQNERIHFIKNYVLENNKSNVSVYITYKILLNEIEKSEISKIISKFDKNLDNSFYINEIKNYCNH